MKNSVKHIGVNGFVWHGDDMIEPEVGSAIDPAIIAAYRESEYRVFAKYDGANARNTCNARDASDANNANLCGQQPFVLRIGQPSAALQTLHQQAGLDSSVFMTACNPFSQIIDEQDNAVRMQALKDELAQIESNRGGLSVFPGMGKHPVNDWPGETSVLALGLDLDCAVALGQRLEQNAIVWCDTRAMPVLVLLR